MDATRFDRLARALAGRRLSRRAALRATSAGAAVALAARGRGALAQEATPTAGGVAEDDASLFVQTAASGTFAPNPAAGAGGTPAAAATPAAESRRGAYLLTLNGHAGETIGFSDRPQRAFGEVKTAQFLKAMGFTAANPPNAALVADSAEQEDDVLLLELLNPAYDEGTMTLTYEADVLQRYRGEVLKPLAAKQQDQTIAEQFGTASLFIDDCPDITTCFAPGLIPVGPVPGGPIGACWSWSAFACLPCNGQSLNYYAGVCNNTYTFCNNQCFVYTA
jgi:hypothetical protein